MPAKALEPLSSPSCLALLQIRDALEAEITAVRETMVAVLGEILPNFDAALRRFLLAVKRDCFNGRSIGRYREKPEWTGLLRASADLAPRILHLEEQLHENDRAFNALFASELTRERRHVLDLIGDPRFLRGVALGSLGLIEKARSRARRYAASGDLRSPEKWEQSLLRFVIRTATKLSANSTLTAYALGSVQGSLAPSVFRFVDSPQQEVSLVRLDRPAAEHLQALVMRHPAVRERSLVSWNDSVEEIEPGRYRFLRDRHWRLEPGAEEFSLAGAAKITVNLRETLVTSVRDALRKGDLRYGALLALLENGHDAAPRSDLGHLADLGLLVLLPPWPSYEPRLERRIGQFLRELPDEPALRATVDALDELLGLEGSFASAPRPESSIDAMKSAVSRLFKEAAFLSGHDGPLTTRAHFFEDVILEPEPFTPAAPDGEIFQIASSSVADILHVAGLAARFAGLFNLRHDILHTLAAWWREHEPGRREAPFLEIAHEFAPVWKRFVPFYATAYEDAFNTFDPLHAASLEELLERRKTILARSRKLLSGSPLGSDLAVWQFQDLVEDLPHRYAPQLGACVFVQPVNAQGTSWVLNALHEGTGRYLSRVVPLLEGRAQQRFLDHLIARSAVEVDGEEADLLEVKYPFGNLVRAHPPQAAKILDIRGMRFDLPRERRVGIGEITIQADLDAETFRLIDASGRRVLPVNLSTLSDNGHSNLLRLLLAFGPGETRGVFPLTRFQGDEDFRSFDRLTCGPLVLGRRRWRIGLERLLADLEGLTAPRAYAVLHKWRRRLDLPAEGFYLDEHTHHGKPKPQYINFDSPSQCNLFLTGIRRMASRNLTLEEALPSPADFPLDASLNPRAFELLIDSLALRTVGGNSFSEVRDHNRENISLRME